MLPIKFHVDWTFSSGKEAKRDFKDGHYCGHFGFLIGTILAIFGVQVTSSFLPSFKSIGLLVQKAKRKIDFQDGRHGGHLGFPIGTILAILIYKSSRCFLPSFKSTGPGM